MNDVTPIFVFSLPRSGSTLTQRLLASPSQIGTASETWLLLPFLYTLREGGIYTEYGHKWTVQAISDFSNELPNGIDDYKQELKQFVLRLYGQSLNEGERYFLEKTPRNHLVVDEIIELFPEAKFIFLWRSPLAVVSSIIKTYGNRWRINDFKIDLFDGLENLVDAYRKYSDRAISVNYEEMVSDPLTVCKKIFTYIGVPYSETDLKNFTEVNLRGKMGDPTGINEYQRVSSDSIEKWRMTLANPARKIWCKRYLNWIGNERLETMGYNLDELQKDLSSIPRNWDGFGGDVKRILYGAVNCTFEGEILKRKRRLLPHWEKIHTHI